MTDGLSLLDLRLLHHELEMIRAADLQMADSVRQRLLGILSGKIFMAKQGQDDISLKYEGRGDVKCEFCGAWVADYIPWGDVYLCPSCAPTEEDKV